MKRNLDSRGTRSVVGMVVVATVLLWAATAAAGSMSFEQLASLQSVREVAMSPDGAMVAYTLNVPRKPGVDEDGRAWVELHVVDADGADAYPLSTFTWLLVYEKTGGRKGQIMNDFLKWMVAEGQGFAPNLGYAPLPAKVADMVKQTVVNVR